MSQSSCREPPDDAAGMGHAVGARRRLGRIVLLQRCRRPGTAGVHRRRIPRGVGGDHPVRSSGAAGGTDAAKRSDLGRILWHGPSQQCRSVLADRLGAAAYRLGRGLDPERLDAALHRDPRALPDQRRAHDRRKAGRGPGGVPRGRGDDRLRCRARSRSACRRAAHVRGRGGFLCVGRHFRATVQDDGDHADGGRHRPGDRVERHSPAAGDGRRPAVDAPGAEPRGHGGADRGRGDLDRAGLCRSTSGSSPRRARPTCFW